MSLLDTEQAESVPTNVLLSSIPATQASLLNSHEVPVSPTVNPIALNKNIEFVYQSSTHYVDLSSVRSKIEFTIKKYDKTTNTWIPIEPSDRVSMINNAHSSLFKDVAIFCNHRQINFCDSSFGYKNYMRALIDKDVNYLEKKQSVMSNFYLDTPYNFSDISQRPKPNNDKTPSGFNDAKNRAFDVRRSDILKKKKMMLINHLEADTQSLTKLILPGTTIKFMFTRADPSFFLLFGEDDENTYNVFIENMELLIPNVEASLSLKLVHTDLLKDHKLKIPILRSELMKSTISAGSTSWRNSSLLTIVPLRLIFAFTDSAADGSASNLNPYQFDHFNISRLTVKLGNEVLKSIDMDFDNNAYLDAYLQLYEHNRTTKTNHISPISYEMFSSGYCLLCVDCQPQNTNTQVGSQLIVKKSVSVDIAFSKPLEKSIVLLVLSEQPRMILQSQERSTFYIDF